ncbi:glycoprotein 3-alpha-L-fucosyltransferase A-like [Clytia hemisphaerica]
MQVTRIKVRELCLLLCLLSLCLIMVVRYRAPEDKKQIRKKRAQHVIPQDKPVPPRYSGKLNSPGDLLIDLERKILLKNEVSNAISDREAENEKRMSQLESKLFQRLNIIESKVNRNEDLLLEIDRLLKTKSKVNEPKPPATKIKLQTRDFSIMYEIHKKVWNKLTESEIKEFYNRERISHLKYNKRILDIERDRHLLMELFPGPDESRDRVTDQLMVKIKVNTTKTIFVSGSNVNNQKKFQADQCNVDKCFITSNPKYASVADALYVEHKMPYRFLREKNINKNRVNMVFQLESSRNYPSISILPDGLNWTASYRVDSVLYAPYERFTSFLNVTELPTKPKENYAKGKTKMAAWYVSNCGAASGRKNYVKELQKYISVDIYGRCGKPCPKNNKKCYDQLNNDYKFYLAFENSNCKDYFTEKVYWNGLFYRIIPVVFGAHPEEYKRIVPPHSYIHTDQFASPKELAEYLIFLDQHDDLYNQYFLWKDTGSFINTKFMCRMCTMVHLAPHFPMWYSDANKWWRSKDNCVDPTKNGDGVSYGTWRNKPLPKQHSNFVKYGYKRYG